MVLKALQSFNRRQGIDCAKHEATSWVLTGLNLWPQSYSSFEKTFRSKTAATGGHRFGPLKLIALLVQMLTQRAVFHDIKCVN